MATIGMVQGEKHFKGNGGLDSMVVSWSRWPLTKVWLWHGSLRWYCSHISQIEEKVSKHRFPHAPLFVCLSAVCLFNSRLCLVTIYVIDKKKTTTFEILANTLSWLTVTKKTSCVTLCWLSPVQYIQYRGLSIPSLIIFLIIVLWTILKGFSTCSIGTLFFTFSWKVPYKQRTIYLWKY